MEEPGYQLCKSSSRPRCFLENSASNKDVRVLVTSSVLLLSGYHRYLVGESKYELNQQVTSCQ
jgi:hypothetical protein